MVVGVEDSGPWPLDQSGSSESRFYSPLPDPPARPVGRRCERASRADLPTIPDRLATRARFPCRGRSRPARDRRSSRPSTNGSGRQTIRGCFIHLRDRGKPAPRPPRACLPLGRPRGCVTRSGEVPKTSEQAGRGVFDRRHRLVRPVQNTAAAREFRHSVRRRPRKPPVAHSELEVGLARQEDFALSWQRDQLLGPIGPVPFVSHRPNSSVCAPPIPPPPIEPRRNEGSSSGGSRFRSRSSRCAQSRARSTIGPGKPRETVPDQGARACPALNNNSSSA